MDESIAKVESAHQRAMGYLLAKAHGLFRERMSATLTGTTLHMGHVLLLASLYAQNGLTQVQLTKIAGIEKSSVVLFLDALEQDGWVERRRHPSDRRAHSVHLTDDGRVRFESIGQALAEAQANALSGLSPSEQTQLETLLVRLITHLSP